jgi:hypothetical protein
VGKALRIDNTEQQLIADVVSFEHDPLGYVMYAFPWGVKGTPLEKMKRPRTWQCDLLRDIGNKLQTQFLTDMFEVLQYATATGHGPGKSALLSMLQLWALSTRVDTRIVVTANTEGQLTSKTWPELAKWHRMCINGHWFHYTATALYSVDPSHEKTWRTDLIPWSDTNTEAFAGLHNAGIRILLIFDEASAIADKIWEVAEGALTDEDTEILWFAFGNPTRNTGRFFDCFHKYRHRWSCRQIDTRDVEGTNKTQIGKWIDDEGEDSDFVRVRVRGIFPRASMMQFIPRDLVDASMKRIVPVGSPRDLAIVGVDVARFGTNQSVIATRLNRDARQFPLKKFRNLPADTLASLVSKHINELKALGLRVVCFIDGGGMGGPVVDFIRALGHDESEVIEVLFGNNADDGAKYFNKRAEMYGRFKDWMAIGAIPKDDELANECTAIEYTFDNRERIQLMKKERMITLGIVSPDTADSLALTFAYEVALPPPPGHREADKETRQGTREKRTSFRHVGGQ